MEETLVLIKPDGVKRQICGEILTRYERKGIRINHSLVNWLILSLLDLY